MQASMTIKDCFRGVRRWLIGGMAAVGILAAANGTARGAAFVYSTFGAGPDGDGIGLASPVPAGSADAANSFYRWQKAAITYSFTANFTSTYGATGQAAVTAAFASLNAAVATNTAPGTDISAAMVGGDAKIIGPSQAYDLQSVALHELLHVLGGDHPDVASKINNNTTGEDTGPWPNPPVIKNYNVNAGAWVVGALPGGSHPVLWSLLSSNTQRRSLTNDDLYLTQFLYSNAVAGNGNGALGGPVFGTGVPFTFSNVATGGDVTIDAGLLGIGTLAATGVTTANFNPNSWNTASSSTVTFALPEPSTLGVIAIVAISGLRRRKRRV